MREVTEHVLLLLLLQSGEMCQRAPRRRDTTAGDDVRRHGDIPDIPQRQRASPAGRPIPRAAGDPAEGKTARRGRTVSRLPGDTEPV